MGNAVSRSGSARPAALETGRRAESGHSADRPGAVGSSAASTGRVGSGGLPPSGSRPASTDTPPRVAHRATASELKNRMDKALLETAPGQQAAFDALKSYGSQPHRLDMARAVAGELAEGATVTSMTFGAAGRSLGNSAADRMIPDPHDMPIGTHAVGDAALRALAGALVAAPMNMLGQVLAPMAGALFSGGRKLVPIPAEALVPQRTDPQGNPLPVTPHEQALRDDIESRQQVIRDSGSVANVASGTGSFSAAQLVRVALEAGLSGAGTDEALRLAAGGGAPPANLAQEFIGLGYTVAVSAAGGAGLSALIATQKLNATVQVPDATGGAQAPPVTLPLFAALPNRPEPLNPPWGGTATQKLASVVARFGNMFVNGVSTQAGWTAHKYLTTPDLGKLSIVVGQMVGGMTYFVGKGIIERNEAVRKEQAAQAAAESRPPPLEPVAEVAVDLHDSGSTVAAPPTP
jgi:hypothetical protein